MTVQATGRRTFFHQRGANAFLDEEHFEFRKNTAKLFHLGYLLLLDKMDRVESEFGTIAARTLFRASEAGYKTSIDVVSEDSDRFAQVVLPALPHVDYCILNEFELGRTTGMEIRGPGGLNLKSLRAAAQQLLEAGVREWVIVHFPEGACALSRDGKLRSQGSLQVPQGALVSTVGAGDAFAAGVLHGLHEEVPIEAALRLGTCAAAACLHAAGTSDGILPLDECLGLADKFGFRPAQSTD
jgi:sugar/nucleoside kinase (ribokinase family)